MAVNEAIIESPERAEVEIPAEYADLSFASDHLQDIFAEAHSFEAASLDFNSPKLNTMFPAQQEPTEIPEQYQPSDIQTEQLTAKFAAETDGGFAGGTSFAAIAENNRVNGTPEKKNNDMRHALAAQAAFTAAQQAALISDYANENRARAAIVFNNFDKRSRLEQDEITKRELEIAEDYAKKKGAPDDVIDDIAAKAVIESSPENQRDAVRESIERSQQTREIARENSVRNEGMHVLANSLEGASAFDPRNAIAKEAANASIVYGTTDLSGIISDNKLIQLANLREEQSAAIQDRIEGMPEQLERSRAILADLEASQTEISGALAEYQFLNDNNMVAALTQEQAKLTESIESQSAKIDFEEAALDYIQEQGDDLKGLGMEEIFAKVMQEDPALIEKYTALSSASQDDLNAFAAANGINPEDLTAAYEQAQNNQETMKIASATIATMAQYETRHDFITSNLDYLDYIKSADPITDDAGNLVYNDPETNRLYFLESDENGDLIANDNGDVTRVYYDDPLEIATLRAEAWDPDGVKFFTNETTKSLDPNNTIIGTFFSESANEDAINAANEDASEVTGGDLADPEYNRDLARENLISKVMSDLNGATEMSCEELERYAEELGLDGDETTQLRASLEHKGIAFSDPYLSPTEPASPVITAEYKPSDLENTPSPMLGS